MPQPILLGHRGARNYAPENTLSAFDLALEHGCHGFEFDVRMSQDLLPVIVHDPHLDDVVIADFSAERIFALHSGIPQLWQVFERYAATAYLNVELKVVGLEAQVAELLETYPPQHGYLVSSFLPEAIKAMHMEAPSIPLGYVCRRRELLKLWQTLPISHLVLQHSLITPGIVEGFHGEGKKVFAWTVNQREQMVDMARSGADGIISDDTRLLCDLFLRQNSAAV